MGQLGKKKAVRALRAQPDLFLWPAHKTRVLLANADGPPRICLGRYSAGSNLFGGFGSQVGHGLRAETWDQPALTPYEYQFLDFLVLLTRFHSLCHCTTY